MKKWKNEKLWLVNEKMIVIVTPYSKQSLLADKLSKNYVKWEIWVESLNNWSSVY